jgi:hypothetical protein
LNHDKSPTCNFGANTEISECFPFDDFLPGFKFRGTTATGVKLVDDFILNILGISVVQLLVFNFLYFLSRNGRGINNSVEIKQLFDWEPTDFRVVAITRLLINELFSVFFWVCDRQL